MRTVKTALFTPDDVLHIAKLANIPISENEKENLTDEFNTTMDAVNQLFKVDVSRVAPMGNVISLTNVFRDDVVDEKSMLTQDQALSNVRRTHKGYFVVKQVVER